MSTLESQIFDPTPSADADPSQMFGDPTPEPGELLELDDEKAAKRAMKLYQSLNPLLQGYLEQAKINEYLRRGVMGARMIKDPSTGQWKARLPTKVTISAEFINKGASLCRKMTGVLTADPPAPDAVPGEGDGDDPSSAEFTTRALVHLDETLRRSDKITRAIDLSHSCATAFERFYYNPTGGGRTPIEIQAGYEPEFDLTGKEIGVLSEAQSAFDAEFRTEPVLDEMGMPMMQPSAEVDELTGDPVQGMEPVTRQVPWPKFRTRYVNKDGSLADKRGPEVATRWQGCIESEVLRFQNVRLYPNTATDIEEAYGAAILAFVPWGKLRRNSNFREKLDALDESERQALFNWKPDWAEAALPQGTERRQLDQARAEGNVDEYLVPVLTTWMDGKKCPEDYPDGLYMVQVGESVLLHRDTWNYEDEDGVPTPLSIPLSQLTLFREGRAHWSGVGLMEIIGPGNEIRAAQIGTMLDYLDRLSSVKTLVPSTSTIDVREFGDRSKRYVSFDPAGGTPFVEDLPPYPQAAGEMFQLMTQELDDDSGLNDDAIAGASSGVEALTQISNVQAALSPQARAVVEFYLRGCRIELEMVRAHYTRERQIKWTGEGGRYKQKAWSRSDLGSSTDVRLEAGTMTMLRPAQKALLAKEYYSLGILPPEEFRVATEKNLGGTLALQDDPYRMRVRRQIEDWKEGPPEGWEPPAPLMQPAFEQVPGVDGLTGQPVMQQGEPVMEEVEDSATGRIVVQQAQEPVVDPMTGQPQHQPDPAAQAIWSSVPADELPTIAAMRLNEIAKLMSTVTYEQAPPLWRLAVESEFYRMQAASTPPMPIEPEEGQQMPDAKPVKKDAGSTGGRMTEQTPDTMSMATAM